jgi:hypothetical protein
MLQKKPADRYQTPLEVFDALAPFVSENVPPPDPLWLPEPPARVALARAVSPAASTPRMSGSTSQIFAAAMQSGSGSSSTSALHRNKAGKSANATTDTDKMARTPSGLKEEQRLSIMKEMAKQVTRTAPEPSHQTRVKNVPKTMSPFNPTVVIIALALALLLALLGIIILLLRG